MKTALVHLRKDNNLTICGVPADLSFSVHNIELVKAYFNNNKYFQHCSGCFTSIDLLDLVDL